MQVDALRPALPGVGDFPKCLKEPSHCFGPADSLDAVKLQPLGGLRLDAYLHTRMDHVHCGHIVVSVSIE